jgi:SET domain-containing protein
VEVNKKIEATHNDGKKKSIVKVEKEKTIVKELYPIFNVNVPRKNNKKTATTLTGKIATK